MSIPGTLDPRARLRAGGAALGLRLRRMGYLPKWLILGVLIGVIAGLGAVTFYTLLRLAGDLFLGLGAGYRVPDPLAEGGTPATVGFPRWWAVPLIVAAGGLVSGALVYWLAPEAEGHGTDAAIEAVHRNPRMIRSRAVAVKMVASAVTIGTGGSGGREGPTAQISAGFGSLLARTLDLSPEDGRIAVSIGIGSGIGAIFGAPLGGAVLAADLVYRDDFEAEALVPGLIAATVGYTTWGLFEGFSPMFGFATPGYAFQPLQLAWFALLGVVSGFVGLLYAGGFHALSRIARRSAVPRFLRPAVGGLFVGLLALAVPQVLGTGYGWVQAALSADSLLGLPLWIVLVLPFAKILATALSIGSGGSGGIFGPGTVIGAFVGSAVWRLAAPLGGAFGVPDSPAPFVVVAMMACFGGISRAPLAIMLMVAEMTGSLTILAPAMVAVGLSYLIVRSRDATIYRSQLRDRSEGQSGRLRLGLPLLNRVPVAVAMAQPRVVLAMDLAASDALARLDLGGVPGAPVVDSAGRFTGTVASAALRGLAEPAAGIGRIVDAAAPSVGVGDDLGKVVDALPEGHGWLTVLDEARRVRGIVSIADVVRAYHAALRSNERLVAQVSAESGLAYVRLAAASPLIGSTLAEAGLPEGVIVVSVRRGAEVLLGAGGVRLRVGDLLTVLAPPELLGSIRQLLAP